MNLISEIINELVDSEKSLTRPLLKTKVWATRLQNPELLGWVDNELTGYRMVKDLPDYRIFKSELLGTYIVGGTMQYSNQPLITLGLDDKLADALTHMRLQGSIASLEGYIAHNESRVLNESIPPEIAIMIEQNYIKHGNNYFNIISCYKQVSIEAIQQVITSVRSKLLEFMLEIEKKFGIETKFEELKKNRKTIETIVHNTIISKGERSVISIGDNTVVTYTNIVKEGDKEGLRDALQKYKVDTSDINDLLGIIDTEKPDREKKLFGGKVNGWISKMVSKSLDGSWQIAVHTAAIILAELIMAYYGMK